MASRGKTANINQMYVADFETCDSDTLYKVLDDGTKLYNQRVWLAGFMNLETMEPVYFTSLDDFMKAILSRGDNLNREYAFHNLKFDGSYIVPWLLKNNYKAVHHKPNPGEFSVLIDDRNNWYSITIQVTKKRRVTLWDSLKLFPTPLEYLHETYGTPTHKIHEDEAFYNAKRGVDHVPTPEELKYMENDLRVLAETLKAHIRLYGLRFKKTQASQSFYNFEQHFKAWKLRFPPLDEDVDAAIRSAYWGGIAYVNPMYAGKDVYNVDVYDINSSYPYQLAYNKLPYGHPVAYYGSGVNPDMSKFWVAEALVKFKLKPGKIPCIPTKAIVEGKPITWEHWLHDSEGIVRIRFCCIDYLTMLESYDLEIINWEWSICWAWKVHPEIQSFILKNNADKVKYRKMARETDDIELKREYLARSQKAKIDNNAFYGKFGEDIVKEGKTPYMDEDNQVWYRVDRYEVLSPGKRKFLPVAMATTAWGRRQLVTLANRLGDDFLYCDTDSIHMLRTGRPKIEKLAAKGEIRLSNLDLGAWDKEGEFDRARYLRPKCYYEEKYGQPPEVTLAGLPADKHSGPRSKRRSCITWDNFHIGLELPPEVTNKLATRRTPTGNKLVPVGFIITEKISLFI